jgi:hypothetical protein
MVGFMQGIVTTAGVAETMTAKTITHNHLPNRIVLWIIKFYQDAISCHLPKVCRFTPSCSHYGYAAFCKYPFFKALWLTISRISRCHPFHKGGYDPLP